MHIATLAQARNVQLLQNGRRTSTTWVVALRSNAKAVRAQLQKAKREQLAAEVTVMESWVRDHTPELHAACAAWLPPQVVELVGVRPADSLLWGTATLPVQGAVQQVLSHGPRSLVNELANVWTQKHLMLRHVDQPKLRSDRKQRSQSLCRLAGFALILHLGKNLLCSRVHF